MSLAAPPPTPPDRAMSRYGIRHDPAVIQAVAEGIENGLTGDEIARLPGMPSATSIERIVAEDADLGLLRARAKDARAHALVREANEIVDAPIPDDVAPQRISAEVTRAKNRSDFRKWLAGCLSRSEYGDKPVVAVQVNTFATAFEGLVGRVDGET